MIVKFLLYYDFLLKKIHYIFLDIFYAFENNRFKTLIT